MKLIDADKVDLVLQEQILLYEGKKKLDTEYCEGRIEAYRWLKLAMKAGKFDPTPPVQPDNPKPGDNVEHKLRPEWGTGKVMAVKDSEKGNALVYFAGREYKYQLTECEFMELEVITDDQPTKEA
jgi:hypothetical protein